MTAVTRLYVWLSGDRRWEPIDADNAPADLSASTALDNWMVRTETPGLYRATIDADGVVIDEAIQDLGSGDQTSD